MKITMFSLKIPNWWEQKYVNDYSEKKPPTFWTSRLSYTPDKRRLFLLLFYIDFVVGIVSKTKQIKNKILCMKYFFLDNDPTKFWSGSRCVGWHSIWRLNLSSWYVPWNQFCERSSGFYGKLTAVQFSIQIATPQTTSPPKRIRPWTVKQTKKPKPTEVVPVKEIEEETTTTTTTTTTTQLPTTTTTEEITTTMPSGPTTEVPFDLLIVGNRTRPLNDRRSGEIVDDSTQLLCDFNNEFACRWGPEAGRWAIIDSGGYFYFGKRLFEYMNF